MQLFSFDPLRKILILIVQTWRVAQNAPFALSYPHKNFHFSKKNSKKNRKTYDPLKISVWVADGEISSNIKFQGSRVDIKIFMRGSKLKIWKKPLSHHNNNNTTTTLSPFCEFALIWGCLFRLQPHMLSRPRRTTTLKTIVFWEKKNSQSSRKQQQILDTI